MTVEAPLNPQLEYRNPTPTPARPKHPVSDAKRRACQENSRRSTGPRTPEGKARSAANAKARSKSEGSARAIRRSVAEAQPVRDREIAIDRVRHRQGRSDAVRVGEGASMACGAPEAGFGRDRFRQFPGEIAARPVKADPHRSPAGAGEDRTMQVAFQVQHQLVSYLANLGDTFCRLDQRRQSPWSRSLIMRKFQDARDRRIVPKQFRHAWAGQDINPGFRITAVYFVQQRHGLHDLSRRRQIDQQDVLKLAAA